MIKISKKNPYTDFSLKDFAESFGVGKNKITGECLKLIKKCDFSYRKLSGKERDDVVIEILNKIANDQQKIGSPERRAVWHKGWQENLNEFVQSGCDLEKLTPKFIRKNQPIRLKGDYVIARNPQFELDYLSVFRLWLFQEYFKNFDNIYEFGCGTGFNLVALSELFPDKSLIGLDFVNSSVELVNKIANSHGIRMRGLLFYMLKPDMNLTIEKNSLIFTFGVIEQLAGRFEKFLQFVLKKSPKLCVHIEPIFELYDPNTLPDYLAIKFHQKRGYSTGFLPRLKQLEKSGKLKILKVKRLFFGSIFMEGYSLIIWKPKRSF